MNWIIDAAINRPRVIIAVLLLILTAGTYAYLDIPKESDPDVNVPIIYVSMTHEGISPEDAERLLIRPMELELRSIEGVKEMTSTATEGHASVTLEFDAGFDVDKALQDVRERVDIAKVELPAETEEPTVNEVNVALFPVIVVTLSGDVPLRTLLRLARDLEDRIEAVPGVLEVDIGGDREEVLEVIIDPVKLESYRISNAELVNIVVSNNKLIAAGSLDTGQGRFGIKVPGLYKTAADVLNIPVKVSNDGVVTLRDITEIRRTFKDAESFARLDGRPAIALEVKKRIGMNIIETIEAVKAAVADEQQHWPESVIVTYTQDRSGDIRIMLSDLQNNIISAIILVMIIVISAMGLRTAGLVGIAIPGSFLIGILYMYLFGMTINIVVLFGLILAVGMLVDGAIVVTEFADRKMAEGLSKKDAYTLAAKRMTWPIISSTLTTLAAFIPLMFWPGVVGEFMRFLPLTLITTLTGSLLMALIFIPTLGAVFGKPGSMNNRTLAALSAAEGGDIRNIGGYTGRYVRILEVCVRHPVKIVLLGVAVLVGVQLYYATHGNGVEFFPNVEPEVALVHVHARGNMSISEQDALVREVEEEILKLDDFKSVYTRVSANQRGGGRDIAEDVIGTIQMEFKDWQERRPAQVVFEDIRKRTAHLAGILVEVREPDVGPPTGKDIQVQLSSRDPERLPAAIAKIRDHLEHGMTGLLDIEDSRPIPGIEWQITVDREMAGRFGADIMTIGKTIQLVTNGIKVDEYRPNDANDEVDIRLRFPDEKRSLDQLDNLRVMTNMGMVPISNFITRTAQQKVGSVNRSNAQRIMTVKANVAPGVLVDDKVREIQKWLTEGADLDPEVSYVFKGQDEEQKKAQDFLGKAFFVALFIMAIILVTQFNSFYHAFLILTAVIMSTIGVFVGLIVTGQTFGIVMTGVGVIALAGIVVNNNIILIDTYAGLRREGMAPLEAVLRTGAQRLRPVMLTTVTTICGLLPMTLQLNINFITREIQFGAPSSQWWVQLSTAVAFGLTFATVLTLLMTPSLLMLGANVGDFFRRLRERRTARQADTGSAVASN